MKYDKYAVGTPGSGGTASLSDGFGEGLELARSRPGSRVIGIYDHYGDMGVEEVWPVNERASVRDWSSSDGRRGSGHKHPPGPRKCPKCGV